MSSKPEFWSERISWKAMLQREKDGRCDVHELFKDFETFMKVLGPKGSPADTLDRIDPKDPEYAPMKVRWASKKIQTRNRSNTIWLIYSGEKYEGASNAKLTLNEWATLTGQKASTMRRRRAEGWTDTENIEGQRERREVSFHLMSERRLLDYKPWPDHISTECEAMFLKTSENFEDRFDFYIRELLPAALRPTICEGRAIALYLNHEEDLERAFDLYPEANENCGQSLPVRAEVWCPCPNTSAEEFEEFLEKFTNEMLECRVKTRELRALRASWQKALKSIVSTSTSAKQSAVREQLRQRYSAKSLDVEND